MTDDPVPSRKYRVRLGHCEATVECHSTDEAIRLARMKLSADMPQLYDEIYRAEKDRFNVTEVHGSTNGV